MKNWLILVGILCASLQNFAQSNPIQRQADWQQEVNYKIQVELDDVKHFLNGNIEIEYINNSPQTLSQICMHLWPNAYKNRETAFAKQFLENGSTKFHFAKDSMLGFIDQLDFKIEGQNVTVNPDKNHIDITWLKLTNPLKSGERVVISTPFRVKIPASFSRLGHEDQSYQITQWYPKPAVYDVNGWNPMPYLDQGEFYSEFGGFEVDITLPQNYFVAATGVLQNPEEWDRIAKREANPHDYKGKVPASSSKKKTLKYVQDNVHDFAWFADKGFNIKSSSVTLASGRVVKTFTFDPAISDNVKYVDQAVLYYSENVGEYPYDYCSAVRGQLKAGGGMEYPMVTIISVFNEEVIVHEVGHNWFYGILGSNERAYPWMDEAVNSYFEWETIQDAKGKLEAQSKLDPRLNLRQNLENVNDFAMEYLAYQGERTHTHQPVNCHSAELTNTNYGVIVYGKGSLVFKHLKAYLGEELFDKCFITYFSDWKFRHPLPGDMKHSFEQTSNKNLDWFFDQIIGSENQVSFAIEGGSDGTINIVNKGGINCPVPVSFGKNGLVQKTIWIEPFTGTKTFTIPADEAYDQVKIDAFEVMFENKRNDNSYYLKGSKQKALKLGIGIEDPELKKLNWLPLIGYNIHDETMLGLAIHNVGFPSKNTEFILAPMFGLGSSELVGYAHVKNIKYLKSSNIHRLESGIMSSRFSFDDELFRDPYVYSRIKPYVKIHFRKSHARSSISKSLGLSYNYQTFDPQFDVAARQKVMDDRTAADTNGRIWRFEPKADQHLIDLSYNFNNRRTIDPYGIRLNAQYGMSSMVSTNGNFEADDFLKVNLTADYFVNYPVKNKGLKIRAFVGAFVIESDNSLYHYRLSPEGGKWDYAKDQVLMGRGATEGMFAHQVLPTDAFLKNSGSIINIGDWIAAVNLESGLPFKLPLGIYMDAFTYKDFKTITPNLDPDNPDAFGYTGGVYVSFGEFMKIYMPLFDSPFLTEIYKLQNQTNFSDRIVFSLNLNLFNLLNAKGKLADSGIF